jgi:hypothetical protein
MNSPRTTAGADLAADLMADLNALPQTSTEVPTILPAADHPRGLALHFVLRVERRGLRLPSLRVNRKFVSMSVGVMSIEASTRSS